jgi:hypothetical protein
MSGLAVSGSKPALVAKIMAAKKCAKVREQDSVLLHKLSTEELLALQSLEELVYEVRCRKDDFGEFQSHFRIMQARSWRSS